MDYHIGSNGNISFLSLERERENESRCLRDRFIQRRDEEVKRRVGGNDVNEIENNLSRDEEIFVTFEGFKNNLIKFWKIQYSSNDKHQIFLDISKRVSAPARIIYKDSLPNAKIENRE